MSKIENVLRKLHEIESGKTGIIIYSTKEQKIISSYNSRLIVPLASAAKVAIGFCVTKWVEEGNLKWDDLVEEISFNPAEDSKELYPHFQSRKSLSLLEAVEVMIACHDSFVSKSIVSAYGGRKKLNQSIQSYYSTINVTEDPRDDDNKAQLDQLLDLMVDIFQGYQRDPLLWTPIINGLIRQQGTIDGVPVHHLNHMTGGLKNVVVDIGIMGDFNENPFIFALGATQLPNRFRDQAADLKIIKAMGLLYKEYEKQW